MNNSDEISYYFKNNYWNKIGIFVKFMRKVFMRREEWKRVQELRIDEIFDKKI